MYIYIPLSYMYMYTCIQYVRTPRRATAPKCPWRPAAPHPSGVHSPEAYHIYIYIYMYMYMYSDDNNDNDNNHYYYLRRSRTCSAAATTCSPSRRTGAS